jgi:hypothetical protein
VILHSQSPGQGERSTLDPQLLFKPRVALTPSEPHIASQPIARQGLGTGSCFWVLHMRTQNNSGFSKLHMGFLLTEQVWAGVVTP